MTESEKIDAMVLQFAILINTTPAILNILYDANLMPEQIEDWRGAVALASICIAYQAGIESLGGCSHADD